VRLRTKLLSAALGVTAVSAVAIATPADAIVGGSTVSSGRYPFMASVQTPGGSHFCGGTVIASQWVLTAAHCVVGSKPGDQVVVVGRTDLTDRSRGQRVTVSQVRVHPKYASTGTHDAALLKLSRSVSVPAIPLARTADNALEKAGTPLVVSGWGVTTPVVGYPGSTTRLKRADVKAVSDARCAQTNRVNGFNPSTEMCASELLADSCYGDSGGPLFYERSGRLVQLGIVSYGLGCATPGFPGVYAEINNSSIAGFIRTATGVPVG